MIADVDSRISTPDRSLVRKTASRFACRMRALDGLDEPGHTRRSIGIAIHSFGIAPRGAPGHERADPASIAIRGGDGSWPAVYIARITIRCSRPALQALRLSSSIVF